MYTDEVSARHTSEIDGAAYYVKRPSLVHRFRRPTNIQITLESERRRRISLGHYARQPRPEQVVLAANHTENRTAVKSACMETDRVNCQIISKT